MGSSTTAAFVVDITGSIQDMRQSLNLAVQEVRSLNQALQITKSLASSIQLPSGAGGATSSNLVAPNPKFTPPSTPPIAATAPGQNTIGGGARIAIGGGGGSSGGGSDTTGSGSSGTGGFTGPTNLTDFVKKYGQGALFASSIVSGMLKSPADAVEAQLLMQRTSFFSGGRSSYGDVNKLQANMAAKGMVNNDFDAMRALAAAQSLGITGPNITQNGGAFGSVAMGVSAASNLLPGLGAEGTMRSFASMQQGRNVNMLRGIGIQLRDDQGNLKPPNQIIEDLWNKICRDYAGAYGAGKKPSEKEVLIALQPGNSLDSMLDRFFGNDPMAKQLIANGILFKAKGGGTIGREEITRLGGTTAASNTFFNTQAESARGLGLVAAAGAAGYQDAASQLLIVSKTMNDKLLPALEALTRANAYALTWLGAGGGAISKVLEFLVGKLSGKAEGGPVDNKVPYIVGEKGPELFVPKSDGTIIPNHNLPNGPFRAEGGGVKAGGHTLKSIGDQRDFAKALLWGLGAPVTDENLDALVQWEGMEGGHWKNTAKYNPLNTTWNVKGTKTMNSSGVRVYKDWQMGLDATLKTLLLSNSEYGYKDIIAALKKGDNKDAVISAIKKSSWAGKGGYGGGGSGSSSDYLNTFFGSDVATELTTMLASLSKLTGTDMSSKSLAALASGGFGSSATVSSGAKTAIINVNGSQDTKKVVEDVLAALKKEGFLVKAGSK